ncbi:uncharacterized protein BX664DRAFT_340533, partial [Halteromyces radiatus]|uniref:uncharacterized protein n=1 Tax=Halteromyces radiatus TaxID=101107 RepID=UPI00221F65F8
MHIPEKLKKVISERKRHFVLHYHDIMLEEADIETLDEQQWLNDNVMTFYMEYTERQVIPRNIKDILLLRPTMTHLLTYSPGKPSDLIGALPPHFEEKRVIFAPINNGTPEAANNGTHWSLLVYFRPTNSFYYYDSLNFTNIKDAKQTAKRMTPLLGSKRKPRFIPSSTPQQTNGADCGLMVISTIEYLLHQIFNHPGNNNGKTLFSMDKSSSMLSPNDIRIMLKSLVYHLRQNDK